MTKTAVKPVAKKKVTATKLSTKKSGAIVKKIIELHKAGKTNAEIEALGYNHWTVRRQVYEYKNKKGAYAPKKGMKLTKKTK